jgi:hypothetical protein
MAISRASALGRLPRAAQEAEGHVLPDRHGIEERPALEQHPEAGEERVAVALGDVLAIQLDGAAVGFHKAEDAFQKDGFSRARAADDDEAFAGLHGQVDAAQDLLGAEGLGDLGEPDHAEKNTSVRM